MGWSDGDDYRNRYRRRYPQFNRNFDKRRYHHWRQKGNYRRTRVWRRKDEVISIFVDNIDPRTAAETIWSQFEKFGEVCDVFISRKRRVHNPKCFGFVKMKGPVNASRAINQMRGRWIESSRIFVKEARFKQQTNKFWNSNDKNPINKSRIFIPKSVEMPRRSFSTPPQDKMEPIEEDKIIKVQLNSNIVEELERSLIGESEEPRSVEVLSQTLTNQWMSISKVRDLGPYKFIVTFREKEDMEHALKMENPLLMQYFSHIFPWDIYQQGDTRRIWLEVMGIPPQVWSRDTCEKIATKFGTLVCCDSNFENPESFVTCRMMIDTNIMSYIAEVLYVSIDEQFIGKSIYVREGSNLTTCYIKQPHSNLVLSSHQWDDTLSVNNHNHGDTHASERVNTGENMAIVGEAPKVHEESNETERTVTVVGNVNYDIDEEIDLFSRKRSFKASLQNSRNPMNIDEDCPPGFQKILNTKKFKRNSKSSLNPKHTRVTNIKLTKKAEGQSIRDEIAVGSGINLEDSIETWSEDDFEDDRNVEEIKSRDLGRSLGFGVGERLDIDELLK